MKMFYNIVVNERLSVRMESLLNKLRVSLTDWDKSRPMDYRGARYVNYTIICTEETYDIIMSYLHA